GLVAVVELLVAPGDELGRRLDQPVEGPDAQPADGADTGHHQADVAREVELDAGPLHFDRDLRAVPPRDVDLPDRRRSDRGPLEALEDLVGPAPELRLDDALRDVRRERLDAVEQLPQRVAVGERQDVGLEREHLPELDEGAAQVLEQQAQALGARERRAAPEPGRPAAEEADRPGEALAPLRRAPELGGEGESVAGEDPDDPGEAGEGDREPPPEAGGRARRRL